MASKVRGIPDNSSRIIPRLVCKDGAAEIDFCVKTFAAVEVNRRLGPGEVMAHALLTIGSEMIMIEGEWPTLPSRAPEPDGSSPVVIFLYVQDVDQTIERAVSNGAKVIMQPENQFWGDRIAWIVDPAGHVWTIASRIEDTTADERSGRWDAIKGKNIINTLLSVMIAIPISLSLLYFGYVAFVTLRYPAPTCENANPVFASEPYDSKVYKSELIRLLKESQNKNTKFWFSKYVDSNHVAVIIQNNKICATAHITVNKWEGFMKHLKEVKGKSYGGALVGVKYSLVDDKNNPEIILLSVQDIID